MKKIISLLLSFTIIFSLTGWKQNTPKAVVEAFIEETRKELLEEVEKGIPELLEEDKEQGTEFYSLINDFDYVIDKETIDGDNATVGVTFKSYNVGEMMTKFMTDLFNKELSSYTSESKDDFEEYAASLMSKMTKETKKAGKTYEKYLAITLKKEDGKWQVVNEEDTKYAIYVAVSGGLVEFVETFGID